MGDLESKVKSARFAQSAKALAPTPVTELLIITFLITGLDLNASSGIAPLPEKVSVPSSSMFHVKPSNEPEVGASVVGSSVVGSSVVGSSA